MILSINILQQSITNISTYIKENNKIENIEQLEKWLLSVSYLKICPGASNIDNILINMDYSLALKDITNK